MIPAISDVSALLAIRLDEFQPKNVIELNEIQAIFEAMLAKKELPKVRSKELQERVTNFCEFCKELPESLLRTTIAKKIDQMMFQVCFPTFFYTFTHTLIEHAFTQYDELFVEPLDYIGKAPIRSLHSYDSVQTLLIRNAVHCLDPDIQILCSRHLHQLLFFSVHKGSIRELTKIDDLRIKSALITHAEGLIHLKERGLTLPHILKRSTPLRIISDWKQICFSLDNNLLTLSHL